MLLPQQAGPRQQQSGSGCRRRGERGQRALPTLVGKAVACMIVFNLRRSGSACARLLSECPLDLFSCGTHSSAPSLEQARSRHRSKLVCIFADLQACMSLLTRCNFNTTLDGSSQFMSLDLDLDLGLRLQAAPGRTRTRQPGRATRPRASASTKLAGPHSHPIIRFEIKLRT